MYILTPRWQPIIHEIPLGLLPFWGNLHTGRDARSNVKKWSQVPFWCLLHHTLLGAAVWTVLLLLMGFSRLSLLRFWRLVWCGWWLVIFTRSLWRHDNGDKHSLILVSLKREELWRRFVPSILHNQVRDWMSLHQRVRNELGEKREVKKASASAQKCSSQLMFFANLRADNDNILVNFQFTPALLKTRSSKMLGGGWGFWDFGFKPWERKRPEVLVGENRTDVIWDARDSAGSASTKDSRELITQQSCEPAASWALRQRRRRERRRKERERERR